MILQEGRVASGQPDVEAGMPVQCSSGVSGSWCGRRWTTAESIQAVESRLRGGEVERRL